MGMTFNCSANIATSHKATEHLKCSVTEELNFKFHCTSVHNKGLKNVVYSFLQKLLPRNPRDIKVYVKK